MKNLKDKVVVITGAASGIGKALAQQFAKLGSHLALNDFNN
jgi:3-oxoacyl-[acyl-carrier protein] reductase